MTPAVGVVALDGPGGSGKSTVARAAAVRLGYAYLDTGSMYRAVTWAVLQAGLDPDDNDRRGDVVATALSAASGLEVGTDPGEPHVALGGRRLDSEVRGEAVTAAVSAVSALPEVRTRLVSAQRRIIAAAPGVDGGIGSTGGIVVEGRDIGTVVAPSAAVKVFLTASPQARARRRAAQDAVQDPAPGDEPRAAPLPRDQVLASTQADLARRDRLDSSRADSPLSAAPDAVVIDATDLSAAEVADRVVALAEAAREQPAVPQPAVPARPRAAPDYSPVLFAVLRVLARGLLRLAFRVRVVGADRVPAHGAVLLAGNHSGFLDGPLVAAFAPRAVRILAKSELYHGALGRFLHRVGQIPVHRGRPDRAALRASLAVLADGGVVGIFPEGTRGTGNLEQVQDGVAYLLRKHPCPVVPVVCQGTREALPHGRRVPRLRTPITISFGAPFTVGADHDQARSRRAVADTAEQVRLQLAGHLHAVRTGQS